MKRHNLKWDEALKEGIALSVAVWSRQRGKLDAEEELKQIRLR